MSTFADTGLQYATPLTINSRERIVRSETLNLKTQAVGNDAQRWDLVITLAPASDRTTVDASKIAIHRNVNGLSKSFTTPMPQYPGIEPSATATVAVNGSVTAWSSTTTYAADDVVQDDSKTWRALKASTNIDPSSDDNDGHWETVNESGDSYVLVDSSAAVTYPSGLFIKFSGSTKVYMVDGEVDIPATGTQLLKVFPPLISKEADNASVDASPDITCYYAPDGTEGITVTDGIITRATVSLVEALT